MPDNTDIFARLVEDHELHRDLLADAAFHRGGTSIHYLEQKLGIGTK